MQISFNPSFAAVKTTPIVDEQTPAENDPNIIIDLGKTKFINAESSFDRWEVRTFFERALSNPNITFSPEQLEQVYNMLAFVIFAQNTKTVSEANQRLADLRTYANQCLAINPNNVECLCLRGTVYWEAGYVILGPKDEQRSYWLLAAAQEFEQAFNADKQKIQLFGIFLAQTYIGLGNYAGALSLYEEVYLQTAEALGVSPTSLYGQDETINHDLDLIIASLEVSSQTDTELLERALRLRGQL